MKKDFDAARRYFDRSIALAPDQQAAYAFKALSYWAQGDTEQADKAMAATPQTPGMFLTYMKSLQARINRDWQEQIRLADEFSVEVLEAPDLWLPVEWLRSDAYHHLGDSTRCST